MNLTFIGPKKLRPHNLMQSTTLPTIAHDLQDRQTHYQRARELASIKERLKNWNRNKQNNRLFRSETLILSKNNSTQLQPEEADVKINKIPKLRLEQFDIGDLIGRGAAATAKLALHKPTGGIFCLKTLRRQKVQANLDKFIQALKIQMCMDHPHVAKVYGIIVDKKFVHLVMEHCMDGDLASNLYAVRNSDDKGKQVLLGITNGLKYLHDRRIHHRDLKLQNILICYGIPKISDFELSVYTKVAFFSRKTICGSPAYFSPEMILTQKYNKKADIWCLGIIFYEVLCGCFPFKVKNMKDLNNIASQQIKDPPREVSAQGIELIKGMLQKDWEKRMSLDMVISHRFLRLG